MLKVAYLLRNLTYLRLHVAVIAELLKRNHVVHLCVFADDRALTKQDTDREMTVVSSLRRNYQNFHYHEIVRIADDTAIVDMVVSRWIEALHFRRATFSGRRSLIERRRGRNRFTRMLNWTVWNIPPVASAFRAVLQFLERRLKPEPSTLRILEHVAPDVVAISPLTSMGLAQVNQLRAAKALGIPTAMVVNSWDNLSSKSQIRNSPDRILVWNAIQRREVKQIHKISDDLVIETGAPSFDDVFCFVPDVDHEIFCRKAGLPTDRPYFLYIGSAIFWQSHSDERVFVQNWLTALRRSRSPALRSAAVMIRPHPKRLAGWKDLSASDDLTVVWPDTPEFSIDAETRSVFLHSIHHCAAVIGLNTSAFWEAAVLGKPTFTIVDSRMAPSQSETIHFDYLRADAGGVVRVAADIPEHLEQLALVFSNPGLTENERSNLLAFLRPRGTEQSAATLAADALCTVSNSVYAPGQRSPFGASLIRGLLRPLGAGLSKLLGTQERIHRFLLMTDPAHPDKGSPVQTIDTGAENGQAIHNYRTMKPPVRAKWRSRRARPGDLIIPVEESVRELDAKLLLAHVAARHGMRVLIGRRDQIEKNLHRARAGVFLAMDLRTPIVFALARAFGHAVVVADEEAVVRYPANIYRRRRVHPHALDFVDALIAWGPDNVALWESNSEIANRYPILMAGNARADLLRPEVRPYHDEKVKQIKEAYGDFCLINTNFGLVINVDNRLNLFRYSPSSELIPGKTAVGMPDDYAMGLWQHKKALFEQFLNMIPLLAAAFPTRRFVLRPHPMEAWHHYEGLVADLPNVDLVHEGNVIPWILAAKALVHNGCSTGMEAYLLDRPAIAYTPVRSPAFDNALPNALSHEARDLTELSDLVSRAFAHGLGPPAMAKTAALADEFVTGRTGSLASERIVFGLAALKIRAASDLPLSDFLLGSLRLARFRQKRTKRDAQATRTVERRFQDVDLTMVRDRLRRLASVLGHATPPKVSEVAHHLYRIAPNSASKEAKLDVAPTTPVPWQHLSPYLARSRQLFPCAQFLAAPIRSARIYGYLKHRMVLTQRGGTNAAEKYAKFTSLPPETAGRNKEWTQSKPLASSLSAPTMATTATAFATLHGHVFNKAGKALRPHCHKQFAAQRFPPWHALQRRFNRLNVHAPVTVLEEPVIILTASHQDYYFHWMFDVLPRLHLAARYPQADGLALFIKQNLPFQQQSLSVLCPQDRQVIDANRHPIIHVPSAIVPCHQISPGRVFPEWVIQFLRQSFLATQDHTAIATGRRIYVSRSRAKHRRVLNEEEIVPGLDSLGFEIIHLEDLTLEEQVQTFHGCDVIIAPHGGGLTNLVFAPRGCKVIELFPVQSLDLYHRLSAALDLSYFYVKSRYGAQTKLDLSDYFISETDLLNTLKHIGI